MQKHENLKSALLKLDNAGYKAYKDIRGYYQFDNFTLIVDYVQGDPFASPSQLRIIVPQTIAKFPIHLYKSHSREVALRDYLARQFDQQAKRVSCQRGIGKSGLIAIAPLGQEVLERTAVHVNTHEIEVRFQVGLPARGRRILGRQATEMLCQDVPQIVQESLLCSSLDISHLQKQVETIEDADWLRQQLREKDLVAFVANGSILPRRSSIDDQPLVHAIPFKSPSSLEVEYDCPNRGLIRGMGIQKGISVIVGGGYHGKSTLLKAIELGIYNHLSGDGREYVVTNPLGVKIKAEDGRSIAGVNISPFLNQLPQGQSTTNFVTTSASGSTSQAANIIEALEIAAELLLIDEDTSATNFMIRDHRMQALIANEKEPITPFIDKVKQLYTDYGVSTVLVMGGNGDYFDVADQVIAMENYLPQDVTAEAKAIATKYPSMRNSAGRKYFGKLTPRVPNKNSIDSRQGKREVKLQSRALEYIIIGESRIDLSSLEQIVDPGQLKAISRAIIYAKEKYMSQQLTLAVISEKVSKDVAMSGLDILSDLSQGDLVQFRSLELAASLNRLRNLSVQQLS